MCSQHQYTVVLQFSLSLWCLLGVIKALPFTDFLAKDGLGPSFEGRCKFPGDFHGNYQLQDDSQPPKKLGFGMREPIQYKPIFVGSTSIPQWGDCYEINGDSYVLYQRNMDGTNCFRCVLLIRRNPNVLQSYFKTDQCFASPDEARRTCADRYEVTPGSGQMLWRTADELLYQHCPLGGYANITYSIGNRQLCSYPASPPSTMHNCQRGHELSIELRSCAFEDQDMNLQCLGTWNSEQDNGEIYFAVYNPEVKEFRCGLLNTATANQGYVMAALANDSTCSNQLFSSSEGYESFTLYQDKKQSWPKDAESCQFPEWMQGDWEMLTVHNDMLSYFHNYDPATMTTIYAKCASSLDADGFFLVYSKNHCGDSVGYQCLNVRKRGSTVMDVRLGTLISRTKDKTACFAANAFENSPWLTLSSRFARSKSDCPLLGTYTTAPLSPNDPSGTFCYNVTADCSDPTSMKIDGYLCNSGAALLSLSRSYQCVTSWKELNYYFMYLVRSDDVMECIMVRPNHGRYDVIFAGPNCDRSVLAKLWDTSEVQRESFDSTQPDRMSLRRKSKCTKPDDTTNVIEYLPTFEYQNEDSSSSNNAHDSGIRVVIKEKHEGSNSSYRTFKVHFLTLILTIYLSLLRFIA